ncbi:MAG: lytic murein transglycosylase [Nocardioides sp.]|nr:lytic murein transglycosylase [Nocardioides sp.]
MDHQGSVAQPSPLIPAGAEDPAVVPAISGDPSVLGRQLVAAERAIRAPGTSRSRLLAAARTAQVAYGRIGRHPGWSATVLKVVPASLRANVTANLRARRELEAIPNSAPKNLLPAWRIQAPAPAGRLLTWYRAASARFGVEWQYLAAVNLIETTFGKIHGLSAAGAQGPMQFIPATWAEYGAGGDINDPHDAIFAAARYLAVRGFARGEVAGALYAYNPTVHYVNAVKAIASVLAADPRSFAGYYRWDVYYPTSSGVLLLPRGFDQRHHTSAAEYARAHPERVVH